MHAQLHSSYSIVTVFNSYDKELINSGAYNFSTAAVFKYIYLFHSVFCILESCLPISAVMFAYKKE